jgi:hypothetical protein
MIFPSKVNEVYKAVNEGEDDSKITVLITGNLRTLFSAVFTGDDSLVMKAFKTISYRLKAYSKSFYSYCKKLFPRLSFVT